MNNGLLFAAMARATATNLKEKARAEYAWRVQAGQLNPQSEDGRAYFDRAEAMPEDE